MKKVFEKLAFAALLSIIPFSMAFALPYTITSTPGSTVSVPTQNAAGTIVFNFDTTSPGANITGDFQYYTGFQGAAAQPFNDPTQYLAVPGGSKGTGSANIKFSGDMDYLGLYWGSIDSYNNITFYNDGSLLSSVPAITGSMINNPADGAQGDPSTNRYVNIYTNFAFDEIRLTSTGIAFEVDNIAVRPVPEPATMLLFGAGIAGLAGLIRRKRS